MLNRGNSYHLRVARYPVWAADNGCFSARWSEDPWLDWLDRLPRDRCLFAVAPDVYPDAGLSLDLGSRWSPILRAMGFPVAIVAQDGAETLEWDWDLLDVLFLGGEAGLDPEWKTSDRAWSLVRRARAAGKEVHMGRVNSLRRLERAREMGCTSADGTHLKYLRRTNRRAAPDDEIQLWLDWLHSHPTLLSYETPGRR